MIKKKSERSKIAPPIELSDEEAYQRIVAWYNSKKNGEHFPEKHKRFIANLERAGLIDP